MNWQRMWDAVDVQLAGFALKAAGAIAVFIVARWLITIALRVLTVALSRQEIDGTLSRYIRTVVKVALNVILIVALLGYFGFETTSFAALVAAMGVAIGAAWAGLLANVAAGAFLILLRPFKVGDFIRAGGVEGTVTEVGLFASTIMTPDNVVTIVGNNKIFSDNVQNFSASPYRRVDRFAQLAHGVDPQDAIRRLKLALAKVPNLDAQHPPDVEIFEFNERGPVLAVRPYTHNSNFWQVYFDTNRVIFETFGAAGYPVPEAYFRLKSIA